MAFNPFKRKAAPDPLGVSQIRSISDKYYGLFNIADQKLQLMALYDTMRREIPFLDVVPRKINRLIGEFVLTSDHPRAEEELRNFQENVQVNWIQRGWRVFQSQMFDSAAAKGYGIGEHILHPNMKTIQRLAVGKPENLALVKRETGEVVLGNADETLQGREFDNPDLIHYLALDTREGRPEGFSPMYSLPFIRDMFMKMQYSFRNAVWRVGDPSFVVIIKSKNPREQAVANKIAANFAADLKSVMKMRADGETGDIVQPLGEGQTLEIKMLGAESELPSFEYPMDLIIDQICAAVSLPAWMLSIRKPEGMSSTLSQQESDMVTADIEWYRDMFDPTIEKIFGTQLILTGNAGARWNWEWEGVSLRDEKIQSESRRNNAQALKIELESLANLIEWGVYTNEQEVEDYLERIGVKNIKGANGWLARRVQDIEAERTMKLMSYRKGLSD